MRVTPIIYDNNRKALMQRSVSSPLSHPVLPQNNSISNAFYYPAFQPSFSGVAFEKDVVQKILGKEFQGAGIYSKITDCIDFKKIAYSKLAQEGLNIVKATDDEIAAHRWSLSLIEGYSEGAENGTHWGTDWVRKYNPFNRKSPLAVSHTLNSEEVNETIFAKNIAMLSNPNLCKSLDIPITNKNGDICLDCVVFDTETTGTKSTDKIIQLASAQVKNGKLFEGGVYDKLINPETPIPEGASAVNGITDLMVKDSPTIGQVLKDFLGQHLNKQNGVIVAYNSKFDVPLLNRAIREYNISSSVELKQKQSHKVLDPFILIQRIHPFLGAKKKLSHQYHWLFCKQMENAHDALADVRGTVDVLKYCLYYLSEHRIDKNIPLSLREVLLFQNGRNLDGILDFSLHNAKNFNANPKFSMSYRYDPLDVDNYFQGYKITKEVLQDVSQEIGPENLAKIKNENIVGELVDLKAQGHRQSAAETKMVTKTGGFENVAYKMRENMKKVLGFAKLEGYNGKSKEEIEELLLEKSKSYESGQAKFIWYKNVNPKDIPDGNDLPDDKITRKVMKESQGE